MADQKILLTLSDEEFILPLAEFQTLHPALCDRTYSTCHMCRELCCPEGTCGLGGGYVETYRATYFQPGESEPTCTWHAEDGGYWDGDDY